MKALTERFVKSLTNVVMPGYNVYYMETVNPQDDEEIVSNEPPNLQINRWISKLNLQI